ncbi:endopeptidase La [Neofamilia massiliensis]|uniref:endopeptidase La n=1 Tax=Neofamilia massiliensis TaxID=1673724 RepID=UPI0006BB67A5|nr:endopeptidase La [Neofamilia massiliensis]
MDENKEILTLPVIPLRNLVVFPQMVTHFDVGRDKSIKAIEEAELENSKILLLSQKDAKIMEPTADDIYKYGTVANIRQILKLPHGQMRVLIEGEYRAKTTSIQESEDMISASFVVIEADESELTIDEEAAFRLVKQDLEAYIAANSKINSTAIDMLNEMETPDLLIDMVASYLPLRLEDAQSLLEVTNRFSRLEKFHAILQKEIELLGIENKINQRVKNQMGQVQKEYYLREQLKAIQAELGDGDEESEADSYIEKIKKLDMPEETKEKVIKEANKLNKINPSSADYGVLLNYLDWIVSIPWGQETLEESIDLDKAEDILDEDHYGLKDVKERIVEFLALRKLNDSSKGPILCLVGPPGVGKTSIAKSVARALDREFVNMSLGGVRDEAEIRGHRRTYVGALPGRVISSMKKAGSVNPVFLLDEIDKVGSDYRGDPSSALLEVLDPAQNYHFTDHYLDVPYDLSKVLFLTTANTTATIPGPLLDRMEVIRLDGYTPFEKLQIAKRYILPKQLKEASIREDQLEISDNALLTIINSYTRESGVRNLERTIQKIIRKAAVLFVRGEKDSIRVNVGNLEKYLGPKIYLYDVLDEANQVGVVNGLAWTSVGGTTLKVEANVTDGSGKVQLTGKLGDVMKESAQAAITYIRSVAEDYKIADDFASKKDIHLHVPEGATPKDGPSAGVTIATAILSALTKKPVRNDIAMTGEITLRGRVLPIGGLKEKLLAANRMGVKTVLIPHENARELDEIEEIIKRPLEIIPVKEVKEVFKYALVDGEDENK